MGKKITDEQPRVYFDCSKCPAYCCSVYERVQVSKRDLNRLARHFGLTHVGIVADEHGFYHASRRKGVIYSRFDQYPARVDGFRRVPLPMPLLAATAAE